MGVANHTERRMLRTPEAAQYLGLSESQLEKWRQTRSGPPFARFGRAIAYDQRDLDSWIADQKVKAGDDDGGEP